MPANPSKSKLQRVTPLLSNETLAALERLRFNPLAGKSSRRRGERLAGRGGSNTEFSDYRDYAPGDDTRFIDWNVYSRLRRPYMKIFKLEEEVDVLLLLDASASMDFDAKFERARSLAAALGAVALFGNLRLSLRVLGREPGSKDFLPPCRGRAALKGLFRFLEGLSAGGQVPLEFGVEDALRRHKGRGISVLLSDFMSFGDLKRPFNSLFSAGLEIYALQMLSPVELDPDLTGDLRLVDSESGAALDISSAGELLDIYHERKAAQAELLLELSRSRQGRFMTFSSELSVDAVVFGPLLKSGCLK